MWWWIAACHRDGRPPAVDAADAAVVDLRRHPFAELSVPPDSLGGREAPTQRFALDAGWNYAGKSRSGALEYTQRVPVKPRGLFFFRETPGVGLVDAAGTRIPYRLGGEPERVTWAYDRRHVRVYLPPGSAAPGDGDFLLDSPLALGREQHLHRSLSQAETDADFVRTRVTEGIAARDGLLLPAPSDAAWDLTVPAGAELTFTPGLVTPEILRGRGSDGAELAVFVTSGEQTEEVLRTSLSPGGDWTPRRVDLTRWTGRPVRLRITTSPGASSDSDLVFLEAPAVASRLRNPRRVIFVFVDTVRVDHLSLYGYGRDTSAAIDHLGAEAAVFTAARSVAPWTLPSSRSVLTGRYPDRWSSSRTLQDLLSEKGFATAFVAGNVYLTANFGMDRDFDYHQEDGLFPSAESTTDDALAWLAAHEGRDAFLQVHYMSAHLPYKEPASYRHRYAGAAPDGLADGFELGDVRRAGAGGKPALQQYIQDRYDNNIRYATDQIQRIVEQLGDDDILVLYADHGEEFWDHKGYEHGHTLFDELLRVPLVIRGRGMPVGRFDQEVSLLDIAPTVLDLLGEPVPAELEGRSLARISSDPTLDGRALAFGWPLYGAERWGVVHDTDKWTTTEGRESLFDLGADPGERDNRLAAGDPANRGPALREELGAALERPVKVAWRFANTAWRAPPPKAPPLWALCSVPGGFSDQWVGDDPLDNMHASIERVSRTEAEKLLREYQITDHPLAEDASAVEMCWRGDMNGPREVYAVPARPFEEIGHAVICSVYQGDADGGVRSTLRVPADRDPRPPGGRSPLGKATLGPSRSLLWSFGIGPAPTAETEALEGRDPEADAMLSMLGYVDKDAKDGRGTPCEPPQVPLAPMAPSP